MSSEGGKIVDCPPPSRVGGACEQGEPLARGKEFLDHFLKAQRRIFAYVLTLLPEPADAEDVFQDVSKLLWEKFDERNPPDDFVAWACRFAYFKVKEHRRSQRQRECSLSDAMFERLAETLETQVGGLRIDKRLEALGGCLGKLDQRDRALLTERFRDGGSVPSVAASLGRSIDGVYKSLARIRQRLRECVERTLAAESHP